MHSRSDLLRGLGNGLPIGLGYLSVSFGFGIMASRAGLSVAETTLISLTNLTSAGQAAGVDVIASHGSLMEMALVQLTINIRYALMALTLSQKLGSRFTLPRRLLAAYGITDEIFAVCAAEKGEIQPNYMYGVILIATIGCLLPQAVTDALGIVLYGMFIAIIVPPARKERPVLFTVAVAAGLSLVCRYLLTMLSGGFAVILCAVVAAAAAAWLFQIKDEEEEDAA